MAELFALLINGRLVSPKTLGAMTSETKETKSDVILVYPTRMTRGGFFCYDEETQVTVPSNAGRCFGHGGVGGHLVFGDLGRNITFAYTPNTFVMNANVRRQQLIDSLYHCLGENLIKSRL